MNTNKNQIYIYTDGACKGNPGPGGWGAFIKYNDKTLELYGGELNTTNNKMELTAVIEALKAIKDKGKPIIIITDSTYVKNGIEQWIHNWKKNGWKSAAKKPVKNMELWQQLDNEVAKINNLKWEWVKGHSGDIGNEKADELANLGVQKVIHQ
jgi:ribonuclease HI